MQLPIYLDYMATTPTDKRVAQAMRAYLTYSGTFGNPASRTHRYGIRAAQAIEKAQAHVATCLNCHPQALTWTSGATESNNLAILGAARFYQRQGKHVITTQIEHPSVLGPFQQLAKEGFEVTYLLPHKNGLIAPDTLSDAMRPDTILVSIIHASNEIGVIQDIAALGNIARANGALFHVDAAQSAGKIPINLQTLPVDLMSLSGHKIYGPKGIGALYVRQEPRVHLLPLCYGGTDEYVLRPGTLATHQIVGMGLAFSIAHTIMQEEHDRLLSYRSRFLEMLQPLEDIRVNGDINQRLAGNLSLSFPGVEATLLQAGLSDIAVSATSACASGSTRVSYVLSAIGLSESLARSTIRLAFGRFTTSDELAYLLDYVPRKLKKLLITR